MSNLITLLLVWWLISWVRKTFLARERPGHCEELARQRLLDGISGMLAKVAKADGHVSAGEVAAASRFLKSLGLTDGEYRRCVAVFNAARGDGRRADHYALMFARVASGEARHLVYEALWSVAAVDGDVEPSEDRLLRQLAFTLGFSEAIYNYCKRLYCGCGWRGTGDDDGANGYGRRREPPSELDSAYARLGCQPSATDDEVRAAYRKQAMKYHPDRLRAEGLPDGLLEKATKTMAEINAAWDVIRRHRGIS